MNPDTIQLHDPSTGATASILAGFGFNCYSFRAPRGGKLHEVLWSAPGFESGGGRASGSGIPLLFPFPGRIAGGRYDFEGRSWQLEPGDGRGNAIHGFVLDRPWQVVERSATHAVGRFQASAVEPNLLDHWPSDFTLTVTYTLDGSSLRAQFDVHNPGPGRLPFGLGAHPYFRLPVDEAENFAQCRVTVPVSGAWELVDLLPTGKPLSGEAPSRLSTGVDFGQTAFDDVFTGLNRRGGTATASIHDPMSGRTISVHFDEAFRECVVYNPPHREAICIEPYTCVPDPFRLTAAGIDAGLRILDPGQSFRASMEIRLD